MHPTARTTFHRGPDSGHTCFFMRSHQGLELDPQIPPTPAWPGHPRGHHTGDRSVSARCPHRLPPRACVTRRNPEMEATQTRQAGRRRCQPCPHGPDVCTGPDPAAQEKGPGAAQASGAPAQSHRLRPGCSLTSWTDRWTSQRGSSGP